MKIIAGSYVRIKPSVLQVMGLEDRPYQVWGDVAKNADFGFVVTVDTGHIASQLMTFNVEDCVSVPMPLKSKREGAIDKEEQLFRLRRDFCLRFGHYPTPNPEGREQARADAVKLFQDPFGELSWAEELKYLEEIKLRAFGLRSEDVAGLASRKDFFGWPSAMLEKTKLESMIRQTATGRFSSAKPNNAPFNPVYDDPTRPR